MFFLHIFIFVLFLQQNLCYLHPFNKKKLPQTNNRTIAVFTQETQSQRETSFQAFEVALKGSEVILGKSCPAGNDVYMGVS